MNQPQLTPEQLAIFQSVTGYSADINHESRLLARLRAKYAACFARLEDILFMNEEGIQTITISSRSKTVVFNNDEVEKTCGWLSEPISQELNSIRQEILDAIKQEHIERNAGRIDDPARQEVLLQLHDFCMPQAQAPKAEQSGSAPDGGPATMWVNRETSAA